MFDVWSLYFAYDQVILAKDEMNISYMFRKLEGEYMKWSLKINASKTKYLVVTGGGQYIELETNVIRAMSNFKYLVVILPSDGDNNREIKSGVRQARTVTR